MFFTAVQKSFFRLTLIREWKRRIVTYRLTDIYPDAVTCDRMRLISAKHDQLGTINIVYY